MDITDVLLQKVESVTDVAMLRERLDSSHQSSWDLIERKVKMQEHYVITYQLCVDFDREVKRQED